MRREWAFFPPVNIEFPARAARVTLLRSTVPQNFKFITNVMKFHLRVRIAVLLGERCRSGS
jgi:hypothetical protein